jgi:hypothetical protein
MTKDIEVASFHSPYRYGEVRLWYSSYNDVYRCTYEIVDDGAKLEAQFCVHAAMYNEVAAMIMDAMDIARTPLNRRS